MSELARQLPRFLLVGGIAVAIDGGVYWALTSAGSMDPILAKRLSFGTGAIWAFFANKFFTFRSQKLTAAEPLLFVVIYLAGWFLNSLIHDVMLRWTHLRSVAFLCATATSTVTNFIGQKWIVFRLAREPAPE